MEYKIIDVLSWRKTPKIIEELNYVGSQEDWNQTFVTIINMAFNKIMSSLDSNELEERHKMGWSKEMRIYASSATEPIFNTLLYYNKENSELLGSKIKVGFADHLHNNLVLCIYCGVQVRIILTDEEV